MAHYYVSKQNNNFQRVNLPTVSQKLEIYEDKYEKTGNPWFVMSILENKNTKKEEAKVFRLDPCGQGKKLWINLTVLISIQEFLWEFS